VLKKANNGGILRALCAILDLDRQADARVQHDRGMHSFRADLGDDRAIGLLEQDRVESVRPPEQERARADRVDYPGGNLFAALRRDSQSGVRARHCLERQSEHHHPAAVRGANQFW
jgi:hypothetical protein